MDKNEDISLLYVEDQDDVRLFLSKILSRHYTKVYLAENGKQGLEMYKLYKPDIIISDIKMPVMDGLSMSTRIKEIDPKAKIILTTAHNDMEYFIQSIEIGINQYILKPIDREKLYTAINNCKDQVILEREFEKQHYSLKKTNEMLSRHERDLRENLQKTIALKENIARSEENFRKVAENIQDAFWLSDNKKILFVNHAFESLFGLPGNELFKDPMVFLNYIVEEDRDIFLKKLKLHDNNDEGQLDAEFRIITPEGKTKHIWYRDLFIQSEAPKNKRRLRTLTDISWRIENDKLQHNLTIAEQSIQIKQRILANVSHEMRTPLNGIMVMSQLLSNTMLTPEQKEYLSIINQSGEALLDITSNLLDINELENSGVIVQHEIIDTSSFFNPIVAEFEEKAKAKNLSISAEFTENFPGKFVSDPGLLSQLMNNILNNAVKFTHQGGIRIHFDARVTEAQRWLLTVKVTDTGVGIKKEYREKIFHLFSQQDEGDNRQYEGLGLGLTIVKKISVILNGYIDVQSETGKGSVITFTFPAAKELPLETKPVIKKRSQVPALNLNILYAEDKEVNQKMITIMLNNAGCNVDIAPNGLEALSMYEEGKYDIILMDIQMPLMDGITATKELRRKHNHLPPIIGISANALRADAQHYISQGLDDYLSKPVLPAVLYEVIKVWSEGKNHPDKPRLINGIPPREVSADYNHLPELDERTLESLNEQTNYDTGVIKDLYATFVHESDVLIKKIKASFSKNKHQELIDATHALKGLSATIGAMKVHHIASEMSKLHKRKLYDKSEALFDVLLRDYYNIIKIIQEKILDPM
jgi:PAS domain S-box-containing protein